jgi:hypothetical protein
MKRIKAISIILFSAFVFSCSNKQDKLDCGNLKTGKFEYRGGFTKKVFVIDRNDSIQTERDEDNGEGMKLRIEWLGPCEYKLTTLAFITNGKDSAVDQSDFPQIKTKILKVTRNYYVCRSTVKGEDIDHRDTMLILK